MLSSAVASVISACERSAHGWELVVVDNSPDGHLRPLVEAWQREHAHLAIRWIPEPRPGLARARNAGMEAARGEYLCFLDDDVLVCPGWLDQVVAAFSLAPGVGGVGGRIVLAFEELPLPRWLEPPMHAWYSELDLGASPRILDGTVKPNGANMAFTREAARAAGAFDPALGRTGAMLLSGEDTDFVQRVTAAGYALVYAPEALVRHRVPAARLRWSWMARRRYWQGVTDAVMASPEQLRREGARAFRRVARAPLALLWHALSASWDPQGASRRVFRLAQELGFWRGARARAR